MGRQKRLEQFFEAVTPAFFTLLMPLIMAAATHMVFISQLMPSLVVISIYYWCMFHPGSLPYTFLFVLGLIEDTLTGMPLGFSSFVNIAFSWVVLNRFNIMGGMSFATIWQRFIALCVTLIMLEWMAMSVYYGSMLPVELPVVKLLSTCLAYPILHSFFTHVYSKVTEFR